MGFGEIACIILGVICIAVIIISFKIPTKAYNRWSFKGVIMGCLLQTLVVSAVVAFCVFSCIGIVYAWDRHHNTMVRVRYVEGDANGRSETWSVKTDGTSFYELEGGHEFHQGTIPTERIPSKSAISAGLGAEVYFDLTNKKVTAIYVGKQMEVLDVD